MELLEEAKALVDLGAGRVKVAELLGVGQSQAARLVARIKAEELVKDDPTILQTSHDLLTQGHGHFGIKTQLNVSELIAQALIDMAREVDPDLGKDAQQARSELLKSIGEIMSLGLGPTNISGKLGISKEEATAAIQEIKAEGLKPKSDKEDLIEQVESTGAGAFQLAKALDCTIGTANKILKRRKGTLSAADDLVKNMLAKGTTLFHLMNRAGVTSHEEVLEIISDNFPNCLLYQKEIENGNHAYTLIPNNSDSFDWMNSNKEKRIFDYSFGKNGDFQTGGDYLYIHINEEYPFDRLRIYQSTDQHLGSKHCDIDRLRRDIETIRKDPHGLFVNTGDTFEWITKLSVGDISEQVLSPNEQVSEAAKLFMPVSHKGLIYVPGNHDKGRGKAVGADLAEVLAHFLKIPYFKSETLVQINFHGELFNIIVDHGRGGGGTVQAILRGAEKYREQSSWFTHFHLNGHHHNSFVMPRVSKVLIPGVGFEFKKTYTISGGSYLKYRGGYAQESNYSPNCQDMQYFDIWKDGRYEPGKVDAEII